MLGSEHDGERAAAALKASNFLREHTLTWSDVLAAEEPRQQTRPATANNNARQTAPSIDWRADLAMCRNCRVSLTEREREFVDTLLAQHRRHHPSQSDAVKLAQMATRLRANYRRSWSSRADAAYGTNN
jgi:hypothetical protein